MALEKRSEELPSPVLSDAENPKYRVLVGDLSCVFGVENCRATGKRVISECRLPVPGHGELCAVQELSLIQKRCREIGAIKYRLEEVRPLKMGTRQVRLAQICPPEVGTPKVGPR